MSRKKKRRKKQFIIGLLKLTLLILLALVLTYFISNYVVQKAVVHSVSMEDTLYDGDNILVEKISLSSGKFKRGDVICFRSYQSEENLIKRVIGLPGEMILIKNQRIYINGREYKEDKHGPTEFGGLASNAFELSEDEYFVLGDNRANSIDSRNEEVGNVKKDDIIGKAFMVYYPFNRMKLVK